MRDKQRVIELQKSLRIAKRALEQLSRNSDSDIASEALDAMFKLEARQPLQGLVGHVRASKEP